MKPTDLTKRHVISAYVEPARQRGVDTIRVKVGSVQKELGWTNRIPSVFSTLSSKDFQREAGVQLVEKTGGPASGGPSTTVQFVYKVLDQPGGSSKAVKPFPNGAGLESLYGLCSETFKALGGGEAFLRREREWDPDAWERYEIEQQKHKSDEAGE
jgi:hypothetical protein